ncbi:MULTISPECIES: hypothetical protein [Haloferax]|jgi:hypothetical protein|uniref:Restriction endonuclease type IV Mrr domain-containing protein n=1 Tax=Haloferax profundi TaxID=1544718 RepID=A0A0W1SA17_9EURY|nr:MULTISPECIES: hypothetical protein [Haloferax]ELK56219.1 hypothetical protein D320_00533 [Haloferax sp. BAB-2207]KTG22190.1 hypothetical protein AUR66_17025 [Haloferax profundi]
MVWQIAVAAGGIALASKVLGESSADHHDVVEQTYDALVDEVPETATVYADHLSHRDKIPNPEGEIDGLTRIPDVVVKSGYANSLIIEVETADSLQNEPSEALEQIQDFSVSGYRRVLVVPNGKSDAEELEGFIEQYDEQISGKYYVSTPGDVAEFL